MANHRGNDPIMIRCFFSLLFVVAIGLLQQARIVSSFHQGVLVKGSTSRHIGLCSVRESVERQDAAAGAAGKNKKKKDNKAMAFLRKIGKVGGEANRDFSQAIGVDEGAAGKSVQSEGGMKPLRKTKGAYPSAAETGIIDDMSEKFPLSRCGTEWTGYTDQVMGGLSHASLSREVYDGRTANVLRGTVRLDNGGGFVQMATNLVAPPRPGAAAAGGGDDDDDSSPSGLLDASSFDGVELDVQSRGGEGAYEKFNVHIKTDACTRPFSSYRATFQAPGGDWTTVRIPWEDFRGHGPGAEGTTLDTKTLKRAGIVAIGEPGKVLLAVSGFGFYGGSQRQQQQESTPLVAE